MDNNQESKFNFEEEQHNQEAKVEQSKEAVKEDAKGLAKSSKNFIKEIFSFRRDTDRDATIEAIKADIPFKGATAWILICSIMVASVGLNANSTAVVIGAMLISPLMGPILGLGMSLAINDIDTLKSSLINLATMIVLSLLTAFLFFKFFPTANIETSELFGRTAPDFRDVLIAFFGGLALIIARTKKGTIASVIFGVAIATALMPPLCTAGYGLAHNWDYFVGAMYLFTINTIFIGLATFIVLKVLRFPMIKYANSKKRRRIAQIVSVLAILVMAPAVLSFVNFIRKSGIENDYNNFLENEVSSNESLWLQREKLYTEEKVIKLFFNGEIAEATESDLKKELQSYEKLKDFTLDINGNKSRSFDKISESLDRAYKDIDEKDNVIDGLQKQILELQETVSGLNQQLENTTSQQQQNSVAFSDLAKDVKIRFSDLTYFAYATMLGSNDFIKVDTVFVANVKWKSGLNDSIVNVKEKELDTWLKQRLNKNEVVIKRD